MDGVVGEVLSCDSDEQSAPSRLVPAELKALVGRVIGSRYRVDEIAGMGSMGVVFRGYHLLMKRQVALKVAVPHLGPEQVSRFRREAEIGGQLDHPNCVRVYEFNSYPEGLHYMVMTFIEGRSLEERLEAPLPPRLAAYWAADLLRAVEHAHRRGIVHRDLTPENILVTRTDDGLETLKVIDFGRAKFVHQGARLDNLNDEALSIAPEEIRSIVDDQRGDLYSAGMVLYRMLCGRLPYGDDCGYHRVCRPNSRPLPMPRFVPAALARIIVAMTAADPQACYASAQQAVEDLEAFVAGQAAVDVGPPVGCPTLPNAEPTSRGSSVNSSPRVPVLADGDGVSHGTRPRWRAAWGVGSMLVVGTIACGATVAGKMLSSKVPDDTKAAALVSGAAAPSVESAAAPSSVSVGVPFVDKHPPLVDVTCLCDSEQLAVSRLVFAMQHDNPCQAFAAGLRYVEAKPTAPLLQLLAGVRVPTEPGCRGLSARLDALVVAPPPAPKPMRRPVRARQSSGAARRSGGMVRPLPAVDDSLAGPPKEPKPEPRDPISVASRLDDGLRAPEAP